MNDPINVTYATWSTIVSANPSFTQHYVTITGGGYVVLAGHSNFVIRATVSGSDIVLFDAAHKANGTVSPSVDDAFALIVATPTAAASSGTAGDTGSAAPSTGTLVMGADAAGLAQPIPLAEDALASGTLAIPICGEDGNVTHLIRVRDNGAMRAEAISYLWQIQDGHVPGHEAFLRATSAVVVSDIALNNPALFGLGVWNEQTSAGQWSLSSDNANDTAAGTGAQKVEVEYLDGAGLPASEVVTLNGTTPVDFVSTSSKYITNMHVIATGTGKKNAGTISVHSAVAGGGQVVAQIIPGKNRGHFGVLYAPSDRSLRIAAVRTATSNKNIVFESHHVRDYSSKGGGMVSSVMHYDVSGKGGENNLLTLPRKLLPNEKIEFFAMADSPGDTGYLTVAWWSE